MPAFAQSLAALVLLVQFALFSAAGAENLAGTWSIAELRDGRIRLTLETGDSTTRSHGVDSHDIDARALGLSAALAAKVPGPVSFSLARDAGSFACAGVAGNGKGRGTFSFAPSDAFVAALRERGYPPFSLEQLLHAAMADVTIDFVDGLRAAGFGRVSYEKLIPLRALGVDRAYARSMRDVFPDIGAETLIPLRALGVSETYVKAMRDAGLNVATSGDAIRLRALDLDLAYVRDLNAVGYGHLSTENLLQLRALGIDAAYIRRVQAHGFAHPTIEELIRLKALDVVSIVTGDRA